uniref:Uncharacterized protein n=1 Tax=Megaselia scalaris TaxID=36166 RepID=T1GMU3_MEGSC
MGVNISKRKDPLKFDSLHAFTIYDDILTDANAFSAPNVYNLFVCTKKVLAYIRATSSAWNTEHSSSRILFSVSTSEGVVMLP